MVAAHPVRVEPLGGVDLRLAGAASVPRFLDARPIERSVDAAAGLAEAVRSANRARAALGVFFTLGLGSIGRLARVIGTAIPHAEQGKHSRPGATGGRPEQAPT